MYKDPAVEEVILSVVMAQLLSFIVAPTTGYRSYRGYRTRRFRVNGQRLPCVTSRMGQR